MNTHECYSRLDQHPDLAGNPIAQVNPLEGGKNQWMMRDNKIYSFCSGGFNYFKRRVKSYQDGFDLLARVSHHKPDAIPLLCRIKRSYGIQY